MTAAARLSRGDAARVLIVDDSLVARSVLARMIDADPRLQVIAAVASAEKARSLLQHQPVDLIVLDLEMPGEGGLDALPALLDAGAGARVLVVSSACDAGAAATVRALSLGAADTLVKPGVGNFAGQFATTLNDKLVRLAECPRASTDAPHTATGHFGVVAIGGSTGGIHALSDLLRAIGPAMGQPILITQHLPSTFSPYFAAQLTLLAGRPCDVASDHMRVRPGRIVIAPGDAHLVVTALSGGGVGIRLSTAPAASGCLPSVDPMFASVAELYRSTALAVMLSGMGRDGLVGAEAVRAAGGAIVVQDRASSVVWGMPGAVAAAGLASATLTPDAIGRLIAGGRKPAW